MTGEVALVVEAEIAGATLERIRRLICFSFVLGRLVMVLQVLFGAEGEVAAVTVIGICTQSLGHAVCLMLAVSSRVVGSGSGNSLACFADVLIVVVHHLLVVVVCSIQSFQCKAFLLFLNGLSFELFSRKVEIASDAFIQGAVTTGPIVFKCFVVPATDMSHAIISEA